MILKLREPSFAALILMFQVIVLDAVQGAGHWTGLLPWWLWLVVGVVCLVLLTCAASHLLRALGVIADEREHKSVFVEQLELMLPL